MPFHDRRTKPVHGRWGNNDTSAFRHPTQPQYLDLRWHTKWEASATTYVMSAAQHDRGFPTSVETLTWIVILFSIALTFPYDLTAFGFAMCTSDILRAL
ncbi:hypothetical protein HBI56_025380 [Parastagonospora nodorum]|uniref:Uncharacterized protein n=1 Tax=Phaeosphaeria nodorum (strain SN15 / ATCC MYA-4574 / FGSC 10173) TaxID=321614 RepID=A0A7U2F1G7_PHANO|nr:hypothetical protein HBH56_013040 [Parastagonospora nodorum]QRC94834.1 hypothetical protein JI435_301760 [Parastagonospora nodorum SN15]KAH3937090.1 hypothetical protein HBH54_021410 [Parastagonospora nodorum]KAH3953799.1 hypothetical protein HBH53_033810 [Parastagonospora nodorum]KAH3969488.1 hypothetical protein HBH51_125960 [Parastagonospora nodorum]